MIVYQLAAQNKDLMKWIPCYCGCGAEAGHQSNLNCFIKVLKSDGTTTWDDHGTRCGTCMDIAIKVAQMNKDGRSTKEIRSAIDGVYSKGFASPTQTPLPQ
jgi:hypothetical protein